MSVIVGLPRLFRRHEYPGFWEDFFRILNIDVVFSPPTDTNLFNTGIKKSSGDACLPLKVLHGHVASLRDQTDAVFVPRFIYPTVVESACPKFCALPDILRLNLPDMTLLETTVDFKKGMAYTLSSLDSLTMALSLNPEVVRSAFLQAMTRPDVPWQGNMPWVKKNTHWRQDDHVRCAPGIGCLEKSRAQSIRDRLQGQDNQDRQSRAGHKTHLESPSMDASSRKPAHKQAIALIGHTYLTQDTFLTMNLRTKIAKYGYEVMDSEAVPYNLKRQRCHPFQNRLFWGVGVESLGTALTLMNDPRIKGLIYITSFSCGIDSIVLELLERQTQTFPAKPRMRLCLDEHTGESGFDTRLEAFFDLLERQLNMDHPTGGEVRTS